MDEPTHSAVEIDAPAPAFEARSTRGTIRLTDYQGQWLILFSHPADFTPVCTSEFITFQKKKPAFDKLNCSLVGLSVDSVFAHLAWIKDIETRFGVTIEFPIIEDISMSVARAYGMIHPHSQTTAAVRSVFFIDPNGIVRAMIHYPMNVGRSVDEILRVLQALQTADAEQVVLPEGWAPGDEALLPAPTSMEEMQWQPDSGWYFSPQSGGRK